jgi:hypothetical protein
MSKMDQKRSFINYWKSGWKNDEIWHKNDPLKFAQKVAQKLIFRGGSGGVKMIKIDGGVRGGPIYKFFEILQFSTKAPPLFDPKIDPYKWPYKNVIPPK